MLKTRIKPSLIITFILLTAILLIFLFSCLWSESHIPDNADRTYLRNRGEIIIAAKESFLPFSCGIDLSSGYEIDLINLLRSELEADIRVIHMPWLTALDKLNNNEIDAISGMRITPERQKKYHFTTPRIYLSLMPWSCLLPLKISQVKKSTRQLLSSIVPSLPMRVLLPWTQLSA